VLVVSAVEIKLLDAFDGELGLLQLDLVGAWSKFRGEETDVVRESGRKEDDLNRWIPREQTASRKTKRFSG
jgi:hypothetical protein